MAKLMARFDMEDKISKRLKTIQGNLESMERYRKRMEKPMIVSAEDKVTKRLGAINNTIKKVLPKKSTIFIEATDKATARTEKIAKFMERRMPRGYNIALSAKDSVTGKVSGISRFLDKKLPKGYSLTIDANGNRAYSEIGRVTNYLDKKLPKGYELKIDANGNEAMVKVGRLMNYLRSNHFKQYEMILTAKDTATEVVKKATAFTRQAMSKGYTATIKAIDLVTKTAGRIASFIRSSIPSVKEVTLKAVDQVTRPLKTIVKGLTSTLGLLGISGGLAGGVVVPLKMVADRQNITSAFEVLLGSTDAAKERLQELTEFASFTPFTRDAIYKASRQLEVFTGSALSTGDGLRLVGDVAAGTQTDLEETAMWFGRLYDGMKNGQPIGEATMRLAEMGAISGEGRVELERLAESSEDMNTKWAQAEQVFSRYNGMMEKLSGNLANLFLGVKSFVDNNIWMPWGEGLADAIQPALVAFRTWRSENSEGIARMASEVKKLGEAFGSKFTNVLSNVGNTLDEQFKILFPDEESELYEVPIGVRFNMVLGNLQDAFFNWWETHGVPLAQTIGEKVGTMYGSVIRGVITSIFGINDTETNNAVIDSGVELGKSFANSFIDAIDPVDLSKRLAGKLVQVNVDAMTGKGSVGSAIGTNLMAAFLVSKIPGAKGLTKLAGKGIWNLGKNFLGKGGAAGAMAAQPSTAADVVTKMGRGARRGAKIYTSMPTAPATPEIAKGGKFLSKLNGFKNITKLPKFLQPLGKIGSKVSKFTKGVPVLSTALAATSLIGMNKDNAGGKIGDFAGTVGGMAAGGKAGAAIGTMIAPGIGTAIGGAVGSAVGGFAGSNLGQKLGEWVQGTVFDPVKWKSGWESTKNFGKETWSNASDLFNIIKESADESIFDSAWWSGKWQAVKDWAGEKLKPVSQVFNTVKEKADETLFNGAWWSEKWDSSLRAISGAWSNVTSWFGELFSGIWDSISTALQPLIQWFDINVWTPLYNGAVDTINFVVGIFVTLWEGVQLIFGPMIEWFNTNIWIPLQTTFESVTAAVGDFFSGAWLFIQETWGTVTEWFDTHILTPLQMGVEIATNAIGEFFSGAWLFIQETWQSVTEWFNINIWMPIQTGVEIVTSAIGQFFSNAWIFIQETWTSVTQWFETNIWSPLQLAVGAVALAIGNFFSEAWSTIQTVWGVVTSWFDTNILSPIQTGFEIATSAVGEFFSDAWSTIQGVWEGATTWFEINVQEPIVAVAEAISSAFETAFGWIGDVIEGARSVGDWIGDKVGGVVDFFIDKGQEKTGLEHRTPAYANGGIINQPHFGLVGEAGPEMIIPLSAGRRGRAMNLYEQTGRMLGVQPYANGGLVGGSVNTPAAQTTQASINVGVGALSVQGIDSTAQQYGESFASSVASGINSNIVSLDAWKQNNIETPMAGLMQEAVGFGSSVVTNFASGQNMTATNTAGYLDQQVKNPFRVIQGGASNWGSGTIAGFKSGQNSTATNTNSYLDKQVKSPFTVIQGGASGWGAGTISNFRSGQNATQIGTQPYLATNVHTPFDQTQAKGSGWGSGTISEFVDGMRSEAGQVQEAAKYLAEQVEKTFRQELGIHSPSRVMMKLGEFASIGIVKGLGNVDIKKFAEGQAGSLAAAFAGMGSIGGNISDWIAAAMMITGVPSSWLGPLSIIAQKESGGNPSAINLWDSNAAKGIPSMGQWLI